MKIKNTFTQTHGKTLILPELGRTHIPTDGILEVDDELGNFLVANTAGQWINAEEPAPAPTPLEQETTKELLDAVDKMTPEELAELAEQSNIIVPAAISSKPDVLKKFIKNKLVKDSK